MTYHNILIAVKNEILTITVNRPDKLNALNRKTIEEIGNAVKDAAADPSIAGIIITGSGSKAFVAGADISEFADFNTDQGKELSAHGHRVFNSIEQCGKPVIAAVNGFALGGGCELAMCCHIRIASDHAKFGQPEVKLGVIPGYGGTQRLAQLIGKGRAFEFLMTAGMIDAQKALHFGLVNDVTSPEQLLARCEELIGKIKTQSPKAVAGVIRCVNANYADGVDGFQKEMDEFGQCFLTDDFKEGTSAFIEKRAAAFKR
ncbi:MAG: enoyl-CoA hydratase-related protein [Bacteroidetes bacterium]|nr:enoyl-CoA hydratase-related protein [Bacteroidota bacterium]